MMRIGFDAKRAFNNTSGLGNYSRFVISELRNYFPSENYFLYTPRLSPQFQNFYTPSNQVQIKQPQGLAKFTKGLWRTAGIKSNLRQDGIELYHGLSNELPFTKTSGTKYVVTIHDLIFIRYPELYKPIDRLIYKQKFRYACEKADKIIAISEQTKQDILTNYKTPAEKIQVIYQDCHAGFHEVRSDAEKTLIKQKYNLPEEFIICVGTLEDRKNQLMLLKAWHQAGAHQNIPIVFIGRRTEYTKKLEAYLVANQLTHAVFFLPYIPTRELPVIYQLATIFVYPSLFEGFGIPILEALNSGVPVITSTGSCFAEAGGPDTLYADPNKPEELAQHLQTVLQNTALRQHIIARGREYAKQFRAEKTIPQIHQLYTSLLKG